MQQSRISCEHMANHTILGFHKIIEIIKHASMTIHVHTMCIGESCCWSFYFLVLVMFSGIIPQTEITLWGFWRTKGLVNVAQAS